jgi:hypothetical protein
MYRSLDPDQIVASLEKLERRINERFSDAGLARVCVELTEVARVTRARAQKIERRNVPLRVCLAILLAACALLLWKIASLIDFSKTAADNVYTVLQGIEATMNILVLTGAAVVFLITLEERIKRRRALAAINELRSIAHVIDMHQLTKDPGSVTSTGTASSPRRVLTSFQLSRYLDYCSEMLSLTAKVAALYAQSMPDPVVSAAVNALEQMTTNLSSKVWQKITIVQNLIDRQPILSAPSVPPSHPVQRD